jgi:hypothetical protein
MYSLLCPTWERAVAWDLREMGSAWGKGGKGGPSPPGGGVDKQSVLSEGRDNVDKDKEGWASQA